MISETERYHGYVIGQIARQNIITNLQQLKTIGNSCYKVNGVGLYIKYSTKRMSPWSFTFIKKHQEEIEHLRNKMGKVYIALVCGEDGVASLNYEELKLVLDEVHDEVERISISRPPRGKYRIKGTDGKLKKSIGISDFPSKLFS